MHKPGPEFRTYVLVTAASHLNRDLPDGLRPTTAVGLSDDSIADRIFGKYFFFFARQPPLVHTVS